MELTSLLDAPQALRPPPEVVAELFAIVQLTSCELRIVSPPPVAESFPRKTQLTTVEPGVEIHAPPALVWPEFPSNRHRSSNGWFPVSRRPPPEDAALSSKTQSRSVVASMQFDERPPP